MPSRSFASSPAHLLALQVQPLVEACSGYGDDVQLWPIGASPATTKEQGVLEITARSKEP